eukprot:3937424-Rhodomonas_salina.1
MSEPFKSFLKGVRAPYPMSGTQIAYDPISPVLTERMVLSADATLLLPDYAWMCGTEKGDAQY